LEPNWSSKKEKIWAWIQIEVDVCGGLVGSFEIILEDKVWNHKVDYWCLPFCFHGFHETGDIRAQCPRLMLDIQPHKNTWRRKSMFGREAQVEVVEVEGHSEKVIIEPKFVSPSS
jgi:hypothetical protein